MPNDFLSNLSSRALQHPEADATGSGLKPRLASRFESTNATATLPVDQTPGQESLVEMEAEANAGRSHLAPAPKQPPVERKYRAPDEGLGSGVLTAQEGQHEEPRHLSENHDTPARHDSFTQMPAAEQVGRSPRRLTPSDSKQAELPSLVRKDANTVQPAAFLSSPGAPPRAEPEQIVESHTTVIEVQSPSIDPNKVIPVSVPSVPTGRVEKAPRHIDVTPIERQSQAPPKGSQIVPALEIPAFKPQSRDPEIREQIPTIHVTIGRIEVKAVPPAAAPKRRASASPTMSLDEYLRRRSGGER